MKFLYFFFFIVWAYCDCSSQWILQQSNTNYNLFGVHMINANTGFVGGDFQTVRKTTNGGLNWVIVNVPNWDYGSISFLNANTGLVAGGPGSIMIQTYDGGTNWVTRFPVYEPGNIQYVDSMIVYATGSYGVQKSINGGISWFLIDTSNFYLNFRSLYFINKDTGTVVGSHALVRTTTNGGTTWTTRIVGLPVQFGDSTLADVKYINAQTGYACGNNGIVIKTTNGGSNWNYKPVGNLCALPSLYFTDADNGTAVGYPCIWRTTNGGANWISQPYPPNPSQEPLEAVYFVNTYTGWIVGFNGTILYTSNGGMTWIKPISNEIPSEYKLYQNYPNPFNPATQIQFTIPKIKSNILLTVFDISGKEVEKLVDGELSAGVYKVDFDGSRYSSGVYFYRLETSSYSETKRMVLVR